MGFDRWVEDRQDTTRHELGDGNYVVFANFVSGPEKLHIANAGLRGVRNERSAIDDVMEAGEGGDGSTQVVEIDLARQKLARIHVYLKDWNAKRQDGTEIPLTRSAINSLSEGALDAIDKALDKHIAEIAKGKAPGASGGETRSTP